MKTQRNTKRWDKCPTARDEGRKAFAANALLAACPYDRGTPEQREWARCWRYSLHVKRTTAKKGHWRRDNSNVMRSNLERQGLVLAESVCNHRNLYFETFLVNPKIRIRWYDPMNCQNRYGAWSILTTQGWSDLVDEDFQGNTLKCLIQGVQVAAACV